MARTPSARIIRDIIPPEMSRAFIISGKQATSATAALLASSVAAAAVASAAAVANDLRGNFNLTLIAIHRGDEIMISPNPASEHGCTFFTPEGYRRDRPETGILFNEGPV